MKNDSWAGGTSRFSWRTSMVLVVLSLLAGAGQAAADVDKGASYAEMANLGQQLGALKPLVAGNQASALAYQTAMDRYLELSLAMGGDDPAQIAHPVVQSEVRPSAAGTFGGLPAGCNTTTTNFANTTPVAIPTGPGVVTSTIVVSGASPYLLDLNMTTQIQHTFSADLDITLTSPAGTVVTITTDNGAGNGTIPPIWADRCPTRPTMDWSPIRPTST